MEKAIQKLNAFLLEQESLPIRDDAKIITPEGVNRAAVINTVKECIRIIKECKDENNKTKC